MTAAGIGSATARAIREVLAGALAADNAVGGVLGVTSADEVLAVIPVGSLDPGGQAPMPAGAVMPIASCSKTFLAVLALQEREAGRLDFDVPIAEYLPWFTPETRGGDITVHHCLTHTAGLPWGRCFTGEAEHSALVLAQVDEPVTVGSLGYSNDAVNLVGLAIERICGRPVHALLRERLLDPLGMADSSAVLTPAVRVGCAPGWISAFDDRPLQGSHPVVAAPWINGATADGSISASATDLCSFVRFLLRGCGGDPAPLLSPDSFGLLRAAHVRLPHGMLAAYSPDSALGYGIVHGEVDGSPLLWHTGRLPGYSSVYVLDPKAGLGVVWLANGESSAELIVRHALATLRAERRGASFPDSGEFSVGAPHGAAEGQFDIVTDGGLRPEGAGADSEAAGVMAAEIAIAAGAGDGVLTAGGASLPLVQSGFVADGYLIDAPGWDRFVLRVERDRDGRPFELVHGPRRWRRHGLPDEITPALPRHAEGCLGEYRSYNPFWPCVRIFARAGELWALLDTWGTEERLESRGDGRFSVGSPSGGSRAAFDTPLDGRFTRLVLDHQPYYRFDLP
jgi:CubicO group peptidase (beta-lactamase class C family)